MRLVDAHITNYRSIEDSEKFDVEPDVTCLVGKNEAGKTGLLQALFRINPVEKVTPFDEELDFPAKRARQRRDYKRGQLVPVVKATFELTDAEVAGVEEALGQGVLLSPRFTLTKGYRSTNGQWSFQFSERTIVAHMVEQLDATARGAVGSPETVEALLTVLDEQDELHSASQAVLQKIKNWGGSGYRCVHAEVAPMLPRFVYFEDYDRMPGKIAIPDLAKRNASNDLTRGEIALFNLLALAGADPEDFDDRSNHERLIRLLENAGNGISEEVFEFWTQNTGLSVKLDVKPPEEGATGALSQGTNLQVRVHNERHGVSVPFDERSRGFVWFFSFLAYFNELEDAEDDTNLILLLDEPGLSLHGRAQADLLRLVDERLAPKHQVIYTTHSPFMVSPTHLGRVRTVIDHDAGGTMVSAEIFKADDDTAAPLLAAMGIEMSQTLFIGPNTLLLEGPSDLIYLDVLNGALGEADRTTLDPRWVKVPVGGAGKLSTFVTLLGSNKLNVAVLIDSSTKDQGALKRLQDNEQMRPDALITLGQIVGKPNADVEDLFDLDYYLALVNTAYAKQLPNPITANDLNNNIPRVVQRIGEYFQKHDINGGHFDHYRPAAVLLRPATAPAALSAHTLDMAEQLFTKLNALIRE